MSRLRPQAGSHDGQQGFTLIELVVVLAILGILVALAVPRYSGAKTKALAVEADTVLQEMKTLAWAYYQEYGTWAGVTPSNFAALLSFTPPPDSASCWDYSVPTAGTAVDIRLQAVGDNDPPKCAPVLGKVMTLTLNSTGASTKSGP